MAERFLMVFFGVSWFSAPGSAFGRRADHTGRRGKVLRGTLGFVPPKRSLFFPRVRFAKTHGAISVPGVIARQRVRPLAGPMTGSGGRSQSSLPLVITGCPAC